MPGDTRGLGVLGSGEDAPGAGCQRVRGERATVTGGAIVLGALIVNELATFRRAAPAAAEHGGDS